MTPVIFRAERSSPHKGDVTAVFPTIPGDYSGSMTCYAHIGQRSACSLGWYLQTRPAEPADYRPLLEELQAIGYDDLRIYSRMTRRHREERRRELRRAAA